MGFNRDGGHGVCELVSESVFFPIGADIPMTEATLLLDIMGTLTATPFGVWSTRSAIDGCRRGRSHRSRHVGDGKIRFGHDFPVVINDLSPMRLQLAETLGGLPVDLNRQSLAQGMQDHGLPEVDLAMDTSGKGAARQACVAALAKHGVLVCIGHGEGLSLTVSPDLIAGAARRDGQRILLLRRACRKPRTAASPSPAACNPSSHIASALRTSSGFELFFQGQTGKVIIEQ